MTFMHKLSRRLAMLKDRWVVFSTAALALATLSACEKPIALTGPDASAVWRLVISPKILTLRQNQTADFTAIGLTSSGNPASGGVSWTVTSGAITDTSTSNGQHYGRFQAASDTGKVVVVVREVAAARIADTAVVTVTPVPVAAVVVIPLTASVQVGGTVQLATATKDSAGAVLGGRAVTWASGNLAVATVSGSGLVAGVAAGTATITATSEGKSGTATVTVTSLPPPPPPPPAPVASVVVSPASASVPVGATVQLTASLKDASGNMLTGRTIAWATSAAGVATVSASGLVTGPAAGTATITATSEGKSGTATVTVTSLPPPPPAPVASVVVSPASASVPVGATVQLTASLKDASGNVLTGRTIAWGTSAAGVATVSASGLVTGSAAGTATITATSEGKSGTALIVVASAPPPGTNPNEPSGYTRFAEHDFSTPITQSTPSATGLMGLWAIDDPTLLPNMTYAVDLGAPRSAPQVFQGKFPAGLQGGFTSIKWQGWDAAADGNSYGTEMREIYLSMWIKIVGPDYENQPVAGTKMGFFGYAEPKSSPGNQGVPKIKVDSPQIRSDFNLRFEQQNTVDRILDQNVDTRRLMTCGVWHRWEMVLRLNTLGVTDGVLRWWVDGTLIMDYSDVTYITPGNTLGFYTFKFWPYWGGIGGSKTRDDYMQVDHIYISGIKK